MVTVKRLPFDITLQDKESSPTTTLQLMLALDKKTQRKQWEEGRFTPIPPGQRTGAVGNSTKDPLQDFIWTQSDWSGGALVPEWSPAKANTYLYSTSDARWKNMVVAGIPRNFGADHGNDVDPISVIIPNPHFEAPTAKIKWTDDNVAGIDITFGDTTDFRPTLFGDQSVKIVTTGTGNAFSFAAANPTVFQGKSISFSMYFKRTAGTGGIRCIISDNVATTNGNTVTASSWTVSTATRTIDAGATSVTFRVEVVTAAGTFYGDDGSVYSGTSLGAGPIVVLDGNKYTYFGRMVCQLRTGTTDTYIWDAVYIHASASATDIAVYKDNVYVAFGAAQDYIYGATTTWTVAAGGAGADNRAVKFGVSRDLLWKAQAINTLRSSSTNPETGVGWSAVYTVGADDIAITSISDHNDMLVVGKEDGLNYYQRVYEDGTSANTFVNITREFETFPNSNHFLITATYAGDSYFGLGTSGMYRLSGQRLQNLTSLISVPEADVSGRVRALAADPIQLFAFVNDRLLSIRPDEEEGRLIPHTLVGPSINTADPAAPGSVDTSDTNAGTGANRDSTSQASWSNPGNLTASDDVYATTNYTFVASYLSDHLQATNFGFSIPTTAIINGITVKVEAKTSLAESHKWYEVKLLKAGSAVGINLADEAALPATEAVKTFGSTSNLWGAAWTAADINATTFGVEIQLRNDQDPLLPMSTASIDNVQITINYTPVSAESAVAPRRAACVWWTISSASHPFLLCHTEGTAADSIPYAVTDVWTLPHTFVTDVMNPFDDTPEIATTHYLVTNKWHGGMPAEQKAFTYLIAWFEDVDATQTTVWKFGLDGADPTSVTLGTMSGSGAVQTLYFDDLTSPLTQAVGRSIQFYIESTYTGSSNKKKLKAFELHSILSPNVVKEWDVMVYLGPAMLNTGQLDPQAKATKKSRLDTLEVQKYPIRFIEDFDGDGTTTTHAAYIVPGSVRRVEDDEYIAPDGVEVWAFKLREVKVSD